MTHFCNCAVVALLSLAACAEVPDGKTGVEWKEPASGVWQISVGKPEKLNLLSELDLHPKWNAINAMPKAELPVNRN